jgi:pectate lyase
VSSDIGGTDPDDDQSMVHLLVYADSFDLEGLVSSPYGPGRKEHILKVIAAYERDYPNLKSHSGKYPTPDALRAISKQGALENPGAAGFGTATEGSAWIVRCARRDDPRPLHVLVWGGIEDLAQALHDAPDILPKLRVYFIGGPNKKWSVDAYNYVEKNHPKLWMIEANATYRGWFVGGNQKGEWGNKEYVTAHIAGHGALGDHFVQAKADIKMGDTPSVARLLRGVSEDPSQPGWGGKFVPIWGGRKTTFDRLTTEADTAEVFGVTEFVLPKPEGFSAQNTATMIFDRGVPASAGVNEGKVLRFRFSPRDAKVWSYVIKSDFAGLDGRSGTFTAAPPPVERTGKPSTVHPNWWIDDPDPTAAEGVHPGAKSVSQWREDFLRDFAERMNRCKPARRGDAPVGAVGATPSGEERFGLIGYANVGSTVTGGAGGETVTVTNGAQLNEYASTKKPCIIRVSGTLEVNGMDTHVGPNKTIIGVGANATLHGGGLYLYKSTNVIIRNLTVKGSTDDNLGMLYSSNVWVDHCTFMNSKDGNLDINRASDNITISWCKFFYETEQPHALACLLGSSDSEVISSNKLHLTFHHNWFGQNVKERMPSIRWGTVHLFNNYYHAPGNNYCIRTRLFAQSRIENNVFEKVKNPWEVYITDTTNAVGKIFATNNLELNTVWGHSTTNTRKGLSIVQIVPGTDAVFTPPYAYTLDPSASVANLVTNFAGAGRGPFAITP